MKTTKRIAAKAVVRNQSLQAASEPFKPWTIGRHRKIKRTSSGPQKVGPQIWELDWDDKLVSTWIEPNAPGLGAWLESRLLQLWGLWHVAQPALSALPGQRKSAATTAASRKNNGPKRLAIIDEIEKLKDKNFDPKRSVPQISTRVGCTQTYVRRILNGK